LSASTPELVLLAAGGHAAEVYSYLVDLGAAGTPVRLLGLIDEGWPVGEWEESRILGGFDALERLLADRPDAPLAYLSAVGNNRIRQALVGKAEKAASGRPLFPWTLRHPAALVGRRAEVGAGTLLAPGSIVTTRTIIGRHCILNVKVTVSHDCVVGDFTNINPGATVCGSVKIGQGCFIGTGATVSNGVSIGDWAVIGAGAVVIRDVPSHVTAVGVPARVVKQHPIPTSGLEKGHG
jgi:sugar O-acyltransferase (sialic acid O-acetyltransferase NeuD family)